jgi:hypothetical protein
MLCTPVTGVASRPRVVASHRRSSTSSRIVTAAHPQPNVQHSTTKTTTTPAAPPPSSSRRTAFASLALAPLAAALMEHAAFPPAARADTECTECSNSNSSLQPVGAVQVESS